MEKNILKSIGFPENEALVYKTLLEQGEIIASKIAELTGLSRVNSYAVLKSLKNKGLVEEFKKRKKFHYRVEPPQRLLEYAEQKKRDFEENEKTLRAIMPSLASEYNLISNKPSVSYFEGIGGVKRVYMSILAEEKEILAYYFIERKREKILGLQPFWDKTDEIIKEKRIPERFIAPDNLDAIEYRKTGIKGLRQGRIVPKKKFSFTVDKNICGNKVALISFRPGNILATLIENKDIALSEKAAFELAWEAAEKYDKEISKKLGI